MKSSNEGPTAVYIYIHLLTTAGIKLSVVWNRNILQVLRVIKLQCDTLLYIPFSFLYCTCISAKKINVYYCCLQFFYTSYGSILSVFLSMITQNGLLHCAVRVIHTCLGHRAVFGTGQGTVMSWRRTGHASHPPTGSRPKTRTPPRLLDSVYFCTPCE